MKKFRKIIILLLMGVASIELVYDLIHLLLGYSYTWVGLLTALINVLIIGIGLDVVRG